MELDKNSSPKVKVAIWYEEPEGYSKGRIESERVLEIIVGPFSHLPHSGLVLTSNTQPTGSKTPLHPDPTGRPILKSGYWLAFRKEFPRPVRLRESPAERETSVIHHNPKPCWRWNKWVRGFKLRA
jgi:hypothetical protein